VYTELFYAIIPTLFSCIFAVLLSLHLAIFLLLVYVNTLYNCASALSL